MRAGGANAYLKNIENGNAFLCHLLWCLAFKDREIGSWAT